MNGVEFQAGNLSDFDDSRRQGEFGRDSMERMGARVTTQTKFNRGLHAGITQDRDLSRGRWANPPRRFESSLFAAIPGYADFPKITLKRRLQFPPWISNIEHGSCRLSSLHWILAHRYSISIRRSLDGRDTSCFLLPCNSIYYFFPQV